MKKILLFCYLLFNNYLSSAIPPDSTGTSPMPLKLSLTTGTGIALKKTATTPFVLQISGYYNLNPKFSLTAGTGYSFYDRISLLPFYAGFRYAFKHPSSWVPFGECQAGYSFTPSSQANGGLLFNCNFGIMHKLNRNFGLQFSTGYELQKLQRLKSHSDEYFNYGFQENLTHHTLLFRIGIQFQVSRNKDK